MSFSRLNISRGLHTKIISVRMPVAPPSLVVCLLCLAVPRLISLGRLRYLLQGRWRIAAMCYSVFQFENLNIFSLVRRGFALHLQI